MEPGLALAEQHEAGGALVRFDQERRPLGQGQFQILDRNRQRSRVELFRGIERQPIEVFDLGHSILAGDPPRLADPFHVELPGRVARARPELNEDVDRQPVAVPRQRASQRLAVALLDAHPCRAGHDFGAGEILRVGPIRALDEGIEIPVGVARQRDPFDAAEQDRDPVGRPAPARRAEHGRPAAPTTTAPPR